MQNLFDSNNENSKSSKFINKFEKFLDDNLSKFVEKKRFEYVCEQKFVKNILNHKFLEDFKQSIHPNILTVFKYIGLFRMIFGVISFLGTIGLFFYSLGNSIVNSIYFALFLLIDIFIFVIGFGVLKYKKRVGVTSMILVRLYLIGLIFNIVMPKVYFYSPYGTYYFNNYASNNISLVFFSFLFFIFVAKHKELFVK